MKITIAIYQTNIIMLVKLMSSITYSFEGHTVNVDTFGYTVDTKFYPWTSVDNFNVGIAGHIYKVEPSCASNGVQIKMFENHFIMGFGDKTEQIIIFTPDYIQSSVTTKNKMLMFWNTNKSGPVRINKKVFTYKGLLNFLNHIRRHDITNARTSLLTAS